METYPCDLSSVETFPPEVLAAYQIMYFLVSNMTFKIIRFQVQDALPKTIFLEDHFPITEGDEMHPRSSWTAASMSPAIHVLTREVFG